MRFTFSPTKMKILGLYLKGENIMSKWTDIRDSIVNELHIPEVTEEAKQRMTLAIVNEGMPLIEQAVDGYVAKLKEQAKSERGWAWGRDAVALPVVLQGAVWAVKMILAKSLDTHGNAAVESMNPAEV